MQFQIWCCFLLLGIADATRIVNNPTCIRQPEGVDASKTPGDNGYRLKISGNPDKYFPGEVYTGQQPLNLFLKLRNMLIKKRDRFILQSSFVTFLKK